MIKQNMSKTPRVDEHLRWRRENGYVAIITQDFARQLETELAEARAEIERLEKQNIEMMAMLKRTTLAIKCITDGTTQSNSMLNVLLIESVNLIKKIEARNE